MQPTLADIQRVIRASLAEENAPLPGPEVPLTEVRLIGRQAVLASVQLVAMLVGVEQRLQDEFGVTVSLMDEHALSQSKSPFRSAGTLADYLSQRLQSGCV